MKSTYETPKTTVLELIEEDILFTSNGLPMPGDNELPWV
jgi:hypothetical protein